MYPNTQEDFMRNRKSNPKSIARSLAMVTQLSLTLLTPLVLCTLVGMWADKKLGTRYLVMAGLVLGLLAGARNAYQMAVHVSRMDEERKE